MNDAALTDADLPDIQGLVTSGYGSLKCSRFVFLQIQQPTQARTWLAQILLHITTSARRSHHAPKLDFAMNIAFTCEGLKAFGVPADTPGMFQREFQEGMGSGERPRALGDTGDSDPTHWDMGGPQPHNEPFHLLLLCYALDDKVLDAKYAAFGAGGLKVVYEQETGRISEKELFGFRDGISQPFLTGK